MKLELRVFVDGQLALQQLAQLSVPAMTAYKIMKNLKLIENETQPYWDTRRKLLEPYGNDKGVVEWPDDETEKKIGAELDEILDQEVNVEVKALPIKALGDIEVTPAILYGAWFMFKD